MVQQLDGIGRRNRQARLQAFDAMYRDDMGTKATCPDCGVRFAPRPWFRVRTVGHNVPLSRVRPGETRELVKYDQCAGCNLDQRTRTPEEWRSDQKTRLDRAHRRHITDDQKRIRARVKWERQYRRKNPTKERIELDVVADHLLSHDEVFRVAKAEAKSTIERMPRLIEQKEREVAGQPKSLAYFEALPAETRHLFGLLRRTDQNRLRLISRSRQELERARALLSAFQPISPAVASGLHLSSRAAESRAAAAWRVAATLMSGQRPTPRSARRSGKRLGTAADTAHRRTPRGVATAAEPRRRADGQFNSPGFPDSSNGGRT